MNKKTILVVDDCEFDRSFFAKVLERRGDFYLLEAENGERCLEIIQATRVDLILMDVMMPGIFGNQVLLKIREKFNPMELPIIMVTSKSETSDIVECLQGGANDYIVKPIEWDIAISRISTHLMLAQVSREMSKIKEMNALDAVITTYNHEINNALTVALGCSNESLLKDESALERLRSSLWRIADILKKIRHLTQQKEVEYGAYGNYSPMLKIK